MSYALCGFVWGLFIPYIARRFAKFMPATFAYALFDICHCRFSLQERSRHFCKSDEACAPVEAL